MDSKIKIVDSSPPPSGDSSPLPALASQPFSLTMTTRRRSASVWPR